MDKKQEAEKVLKTIIDQIKNPDLDVIDIEVETGEEAISFFATPLDEPIFNQGQAKKLKLTLKVLPKPRVDDFAVVSARQHLSIFKSMGKAEQRLADELNCKNEKRLFWIVIATLMAFIIFLPN